MTTTQVTITELESDIQYLQANLANGWYNNQNEKNEVSAELEELKAQVIRLRKTK